MPLFLYPNTKYREYIINYKKRSLFTCFLLLLSTASFAFNCENLEAVVLPINEIVNPKINLFFEAPKGFVVTPDSCEDFKKRGTGLTYVPENDSDSYRPIITLMSAAGSKVPSYEALQVNIEDITQKAKRSHVVFQKTKKQKNYMFSSAVIQYQLDNFAPKAVLAYVAFYSGPYDTSGVIYGKLFDHWMEGEEEKKAADLEEKFIEEHLQVIEAKK